MDKPSSPKKSGGPSSSGTADATGNSTRAASTGWGSLTFERVPVTTPAPPVRSGLGLALLEPPVHGPAQPSIPEPRQWLSNPTRQPLRGYVHMTSPENLQEIHDEGLVADKKKGFGTPQDGGMRDKEGVYVVDDPHFYRGDTASGHVGVVSTREPVHDTNYPHSPKFTRHGAGYFMNRVAPLRDAITEGHGPTDPYSFTLPMTPRTAQGAQRLLTATEGRNLTTREAAEAVGGVVTKRFPAYFLDPFRSSSSAPRQPPPMGPIASSSSHTPQSGAASSSSLAPPSSFASPSSPARPTSSALPSSFPALAATPAQRIGNASSPAVQPRADNATVHGAWPPVIHENYFRR